MIVYNWRFHVRVDVEVCSGSLFVLLMFLGFHEVVNIKQLLHLAGGCTQRLSRFCIGLAPRSSRDCRADFPIGINDWKRYELWRPARGSKGTFVSAVSSFCSLSRLYQGREKVKAKSSACLPAVFYCAIFIGLISLGNRPSHEVSAPVSARQFFVFVYFLNSTIKKIYDEKILLLSIELGFLRNSEMDLNRCPGATANGLYFCGSTFSKMSNGRYASCDLFPTAFGNNFWR